MNFLYVTVTQAGGITLRLQMAGISKVPAIFFGVIE